MLDSVKNKGDMYMGTYLPKIFVGEFDRYAKSKNVSSSIRNITKRELIYEALKEKMEKDGFQITKPSVY